jgi:hypothetical protein
MALKNLRLEPTDNGMKVCWVCQEKSNPNITFGGNDIYKPYEMGFKDGEEKEAMACFMEQKAKMREESKEEDY